MGPAVMLHNGSPSVQLGDPLSKSLHMHIAEQDLKCAMESRHWADLKICCLGLRTACGTLSEKQRWLKALLDPGGVSSGESAEPVRNVSLGGIQGRLGGGRLRRLQQRRQA